jgi:hypothetical protein
VVETKAMAKSIAKVFDRIILLHWAWYLMVS